LVSVLIPCYNAQDYIADALESVINQTYPNLEIIVVDDGSTDSSRRVLLDYAARDNRIILHFQDNRGPSAARNKAFELSKGEWIQYLDADDLLSSNKIAKQVEVAVRRKIDDSIIYGDIKIVGYGDVEMDKEFRTVDFNDPIQFLFHNSFECGNTGVHLIPRLIIEKIDPWDESAMILEDLDFFCRAIIASSAVFYAEGAVFYYRIQKNRQSLSKSRSNFFSHDSWRMTKKVATLLLANIDPLDMHSRKIVAKFIFTWIWSVYPAMKLERAAATSMLSEMGFHPSKLNISQKSNFFISFLGLNTTFSILFLYRKIRICCMGRKQD